MDSENSKVIEVSLSDYHQMLEWGRELNASLKKYNTYLDQENDLLRRETRLINNIRKFSEYKDEVNESINRKYIIWLISIVILMITFVYLLIKIDGIELKSIICGIVFSMILFVTFKMIESIKTLITDSKTCSVVYVQLEAGGEWLKAISVGRYESDEKIICNGELVKEPYDIKNAFHEGTFKF